MFHFQTHLPAIDALCEQYGVERLQAFGSALSDNFGPESDIDFLVNFKKEHELSLFSRWMALQADLSQLLQRPVDLVPAEGITNPYLNQAIASAQLTIYEPDKFTALCTKPSN
jgi:uncharacterized protein